MPNENPDDQTDETTDPAEQSGDEQQPTDDGGTTSELSHKDALEALTEARSEAANYRVKLRAAEAKLAETEQKLAAATTPEAIEDLRSELATEVAKNAELARELLVRDIAGKHNLTDELAEIIRDLAESGKDEDALNTRAKALAELVPVERHEPESLSGGLNPLDPGDTLPNNPRELAQMTPRRSRR